MLDDLSSVPFITGFREASGLPGWRTRPPRAKKSRMPFHGRQSGPSSLLKMAVEEFRSKEDRDARFAELRGAGAKDLSKHSDYEGGRTVWRVVHN